MKAKREHRVPLCGRALEIFDAARKLGDGNPLVFPMRSGRPISASTLLKMLNDLRIAAVPQSKHSSYSGSGGGAGVDPPRSANFLIL